MKSNHRLVKVAWVLCFVRTTEVKPLVGNKESATRRPPSSLGMAEGQRTPTIRALELIGKELGM
jgi:hypothetical protein